MSDNNSTQNPRLTLSDVIFIIFLISILVFLGWSGSLAYSEGMKTEATKRNGEAWASWLTEAGTERFNANYAISECAPVVHVDNTKPELNTPRTWGECLKAITTTSTPLATLTNPFFNTPITFVAKCSRGDQSLIGSMVLEKLIPTPVGSSLPFTISQLVESDHIDQKTQIRITVCDNGAYPIFIADVEF